MDRALTVCRSTFKSIIRDTFKRDIQRKYVTHIQNIKYQQRNLEKQLAESRIVIREHERTHMMKTAISNTLIGFKRCKHRYIAGSSKYSTKPWSFLYTKLITSITCKQILQKYCKTAYPRSGINRMWILNTPEKDFPVLN